MITIRRAGFLALAVLSLFASSGVAQSPQKIAPQAPGAVVTAIKLSFKRDPRMIDPFRGVAPWSVGPNYVGAYAQDTVEAKAEGINAAGQASNISAEWIASDPKMVTVTPIQDGGVKIKVLGAGESKLNVTYQGLTQELVIKAKTSGKYIQLQISPAALPKPSAPAIQGPSSTLKTKKEEVSYAVGMNIAKALQKQSVEVDDDLLEKGLEDTLAGNKTLLSDERAAAVLAGVDMDQRIVQANLDRKALSEKNKREGESFLVDNKRKEGVVTLPSGLQYKIIKAGSGQVPKATDVVSCHYRGTFIDGTTFDSKEKIPVSFPVKAVIKGWAEALQLMPAGSKWQLFVPSDLAYGERGSGGGHRHGPQIIGPNAALVFDLELLSVENAADVATTGATDQKLLDSAAIEALRKTLQVEPQQ
jgi:FKBP-type peptidyl-prolyl cis-trans isomerase FklB